MTVTVANTANNNTFDYWRNRTNELAYAMSTYAVTVNSNTASGNAAITGTFTANSVITNSLSVNSAVTFGNSSVNTYVNSTFISTGNATVNSFMNSYAVSAYNVYVGANVIINTTSFFIGNTTANGTINYDTIYLRSNSSTSALINTIGLFITNGANSISLNPSSLSYLPITINNSVITTGTGGFTANTTTMKVGSNVITNTSSLLIGNSTINSVHTNIDLIIQANSSANAVVNSTVVQLSNSVSVASLVPSSLFVGNSTTNSTITSSSLNVNGVFVVNNAGIFATSLINSSSFSVGTSTIANSTGVYTGVVNAASHTVGTSTIANSTGVYTSGTVNAASHTIGTSTIANSTGVYAGVVNGSSIQVGVLFTANGTLVNAVALNVTNQTNTGTLYVATSANIGSTTVANSTGVYTGVVNGSSIQVGTSTVANSTGVYTGIVNGSSIQVGTSTIANVSGLYAIGTINAASHTVGTSTIANSTGVYTGVVNGSSIQVGSATIANSLGLYTGVISGSSLTIGSSLSSNSIVTNTASLNVVNQTNTGTLYVATSANISSTTLANATGVYISGTINAASHTVGTSTIANSTGVYTGVVNGSSIQVGTSTVVNSTGVYTGIVNGSSIQVGTSFTANSTLINSAAINVSGQINTATLFSSSSSNVGGNLQISTQGLYILGNTTTQPTLNISSNSTVSGLYIGNSSVTGAPRLVIANSAGNVSINTTSIYTSWGFVANSTSVTLPGTVSATLGNTQINGWANVAQDLFVLGNLNVSGNITYSGTSTGDVIPPSNNYSLGNTSNRWTLYSVQILNVGNTSTNNISVSYNTNSASFTVGSDFIANSLGVYITGTANVSTLTTGGGFNTPANGVSINSTSVWIGNSSVKSTINATFFTGIANNVSFVGTTAAAAVVNTSQLSSNLSNYALLSGATFGGALNVANDVSITGNLIVTGSTVYANVTNLDVKDLNITLAKGATSNSVTDGAGLTIDTSNIGWYYNFGSNTWQSNVGITPSSNNSFNLGTTGLRWATVFANNVTVTNTVSTGTLTAINVSSTDIYGVVKTSIQGTIDHNSLNNYVANKHIDHTTVTISAGNGLTGGGDISANRTLTVVGSNGISITSTGVNAKGSNGITVNSGGIEAKAANGISVDSSGINVLVGNSQLISNSTGVWANQATFNHNSLSNYVSSQHIDHTTVTISAGNGLSGGGDISANRTLAVLANNGLLSNSTGVFVVANNGLLSNSTGVFVVANSGIASNSSGLFVVANNGLLSNSSGLFIVANNGLLSNSTGVFVVANTGIVSNSSGLFANATYIQNLAATPVTNGSIDTSGSSTQTIDTFAIASYRGAEYLITVSDKNANNKYISKILVLNDGSSAQITEYGSITSNSYVGAFSATQDATNIILQFTPNSSMTSTTVKFTRMVV